MRPPDRSEERELRSEVEQEQARSAETQSRVTRLLDTLNQNQLALVAAYRSPKGNKRK